MKYWLYENGSISGPFEAQELLIKPSFGPDSMVCEASLSGSSPDDWKRAAVVPELSSFSVLTQDKFQPSNSDYPFDYQSELSHPNIIDSIDDTLSSLDFLSSSQVEEETDSFDLKISQIKEQLETAVWEKNLLMEKVNIKEAREKEYREKIKELEERVDELIKSSLKKAYETSGLRPEPVSAVKEEAEEKTEAEGLKTEPAGKVEVKTGISKKSEEIPAESPQKESSFSKEEKMETVQKPQIEEKRESFKKISADMDNYKLGSERLIDSYPQEKEDMEIFDLKSFGSQKLEANPYEKVSIEPDFSPSIIEISKPAAEIDADFSQIAAKKNIPQTDIGKQENAAGLAQTPQEYKPFEETAKPEPAENAAEPPVFIPEPQPEIPEFKPETALKKEPEPQKTETVQSVNPSEPKKPDIKVSTGSFSNISEINIEIPAASKSHVLDIPSMTARRKKDEETSSAAKAEAVSLSPSEPKTPIDPQVTQRIEVKNLKQTVVVPARQTAYSPRKNKFKLYISLAISLMIIVGGFLFLVDFRKSSKKSNLMTASAAAAGEKSMQETQSPAAQQTPQEETKPQQEKDAGAQEEAVETSQPSVSINQGVQKAIDSVKNFNLSDGRGTVSNWFSNSFVSSGQSREEWTATLLQGKIFVVQYRLIRQKQEPLVYQFEVDSESGRILRGINNNAIDLLESSSEKNQAKKSVQQAKPKPVRVKKPAAAKKDSLMPLPERDAEDYSEPTGFENSDMISKAPLKITAPESDDELF